MSQPTTRLSLTRLVNQSTVLLMVTIGTIIFILALLILFHQNATATKGYTLRKLERDRSRLLLTEEVLNMKKAEAQALKNIESDKQVEAMIPVRGQDYVKTENSVADSLSAQ